MKSADRLNGLNSSMPTTEKCCESIGWTGLYPYAIDNQDERRFETRQFPKSSGYPEDAATGIAAAALAFGILKNGLVKLDGSRITVLQGRPLGFLSEIGVRLDFSEEALVGCLVGGQPGSSVRKYGDFPESALRARSGRSTARDI